MACCHSEALLDQFSKLLLDVSEGRTTKTFIVLLFFDYFLLYFTPYAYLYGMLAPSFCSSLSPIKMAQNKVIKDLLDNPPSVVPLHDKLRIMIKVDLTHHHPM
jgi:hypothetical protein